MRAERKAERTRLPFASASDLSAEARFEITEALEASVADGIDLHTQAKVAHWNVKGPQFSEMHALFETVAETIASQTDDLAERAVALGTWIDGTARHVAASSRLPDYAPGTTAAADHVRLLVQRLDKHLHGLREALELCQTHQDDVTVDMLTGMTGALEKLGWMLRATLET